MSRSSANDGKNSVSNIGGFYDSRARLSNERGGAEFGDSP